MITFLKKYWLSIILIGIICLLLIEKCNYVPVITPGIHTHSTDTVTIYRPYIPAPVKPNNIPVKIEIFEKKDSALRKEVEKKPIIENVDIIKNEAGQVDEVDITTIDTTGKVETDVHKIEPDSKEIVIDNIGQVEEKKRSKTHKALVKIWKGTKTGLMIVGGLTIAVLAATHL